ncbi:MAG: MMPL family transporter, partial [Planctomycetaceae bacterium]|nr:MMPL family transporter [Planctomycetaceae bacterium]
FLTSLTTAIGFLSMNASDSPPFQELGNIAAFGVTMAFFFSILLFPALVIMLPMKGKIQQAERSPWVEGVYHAVVTRPNTIFLSLLVMAAILIAFMFKNELNDDTVEYFAKDVPFRQAADYTQENLTGFDIIAYSLDSGRTNGVTDPDFLAKVEAFNQWFLAQPEIVQVSSFTNVMKRLNQNMHENNPAWYRLPDSPELAAQYLLLYEMSLPYGLDLNNQINLDKSSTLVRVRVKNQKANQLIELDERAARWLQQNAPEIASHGASISLMFAHIGQRNIDSMLTGSLWALVLVTLTLIIA